MKKKLTNTFEKGMHCDNLESLQPAGTYREAWSAINTNREGQGNIGIPNEPSNELFVSLPDGYNIRGMAYAEERNEIVVFLNNGFESEIGIINEDKKSYRKIVDDKKLGKPLGFNGLEWIQIELKVMQPCNQMHAYWSNNQTYKFLNLDDPCCKFEDMLLFECACPATIEASVIGGAGGGGLPNGVYQFAIQLIDQGGNKTNWFHLSEPVSVGQGTQGDNIPGDRSGKSINIKVDDLSANFGTANIAVISKIGGVTVSRQVDTVAYGQGLLSYTYRGDTGKEREIKIGEILKKKDNYIKGDGLMEWDNRLALYNTVPKNNIDYQRQANQITKLYQIYGVPAKEEHKYHGLRPNENYWFAIRWNYCDGTTSAWFALPGRSAEGLGKETIDGCGDCEYDVWVCKDTSERTTLYCDSIDFTSEYNVTTRYNTEINISAEYDEEGNPIHPDNIDFRSGMEDLAQSVADVTSAAPADTFENMKCQCDNLVEVLSDAKAKMDGSPDNAMRALTALNRKDSYQMVCDCQELKYPDSTQKVYKDNVFTDLYDCIIDPAANTPSDCVNPRETVVDDRADDSTGTVKIDNEGTTCSSGGCGGGGSLDGFETQCGEGPIEKKEGLGGGECERAMRSINEVAAIYESFICNRVEINDVRYKSTGQKCSGRLATRTVGDVTHRCINGEWHIAESGVLRDNEAIYSSLPTANSALATATGTACATSSATPTAMCSPVPIYGDDGCTIIGYKPFLYSEGKFGIWLTDEIYPLTENHECQPIYGNLAGERVRLDRAPSVSKEPFFFSKRTGVPNEYDLGNKEEDMAFVFKIGVRFDGITIPENLPKPLCDKNPYSIGQVERTESNKSIIATGALFNTFSGRSQSEQYAFGKHAVNSPEYYDVSINPNDGNGSRNFRGGDGETQVPAYIFHSPDTHFLRPDLDPWIVHIEGEMAGTGWRHDLYARGPKPEGFFKGRQQQKGTRQSINLNKWNAYENTVTQCVRAASYAPANSIVSNEDQFTLPLMNLWRESSVYVELNGSKPQFSVSGTITPQTNGADNRFSDESFEGDTEIHKKDIHGRTLYGTFRRYLPRQYGSPIGQAYIPIGLEAEKRNLDTGSIAGLVGDSYTGWHTFRRTSYISDKVPSAISETPEVPIEIILIPEIGFLLADIWTSIGARSCGELPLNDDGSFLNQRGGLNGRDGHNPADGNDIYFPSVLKTNIFSWFPSDVNVKHRGTGVVDEVYAEVYAKRTKSLQYDSTMPDGDDWKSSWLNRFYVQWNEPSGFKKLAMAIILFAFVYGIGLWIIIEGLILIGSSLLGTAGGLVLIGIGALWIGLWAGSSTDNRLVANALGIDLCFPDKEFPDDPEGAEFGQKKGRVKQFEDNYYQYNIDYSCQNSISAGFGMGDPYFTEYCPEKRNNEIYLSNPQQPGNFIDAWKNFEPENFTEFPLDLGNISKMFTMYGKLYAHTTDSIVALPRGGNGRLFGRPTPIGGGIKEGYGGLLDPNAACVTRWGYVFPDRESRDWYVFNGSGLEDIPELGLQHFMDNQMHFSLLEQFPDFKNVDTKAPGGIGYSFGIDNRNNRFIFTKRDYKPITKGITLSDDGCTFMKDGKIISLGNKKYFCENHHTVSFDARRKEWISYHFYHPAIYHWNRFDLWSFNGGMWRHNAEGSFQNFYGKQFPFIIEFIVNDLETLDQFTVENLTMDVETQKWKDCAYIKSSKEFFDRGHFYNSHQSTGEVQILEGQDQAEDALGKASEEGKVIKYEYDIRRFRFNRFLDDLIDCDDHIFLCPECFGDKDENGYNHGNKDKNLANAHKMTDNFWAVRLIYNNPGDVKMIAKVAITAVDDSDAL